MRLCIPWFTRNNGQIKSNRILARFLPKYDVTLKLYLLYYNQCIYWLYKVYICLLYTCNLLVLKHNKQWWNMNHTVYMPVRSSTKRSNDFVFLCKFNFFFAYIEMQYKHDRHVKICSHRKTLGIPCLILFPPTRLAWYNWNIVKHVWWGEKHLLSISRNHK